MCGTSSDLLYLLRVEYSLFTRGDKQTRKSTPFPASASDQVLQRHRDAIRAAHIWGDWLGSSTAQYYLALRFFWCNFNNEKHTVLKNNVSRFVGATLPYTGDGVGPGRARRQVSGIDRSVRVCGSVRQIIMSALA